LPVALNFVALAGLLDFAAPLPFEGLAPYWIVVMWANFGLTLDSCLRWLQRQLLFGAACGAVGGRSPTWPV
jgi:hypothetical protein